MSKLRFLSFLLCFITWNSFANPVVNVYIWGGEIPKTVIKQFEATSGINVNFSTYDSNETMYAKLKASHKTNYDVIMPSAYFVERMKKQGMLETLDHQRLNNIHNLDKRFVNNDYDPNNQYSVPIVWGSTGIVFNQQFIKTPIKQWTELWDNRWKNQLMLLDDSREVFAIALMSLGYNPNDALPDHIKAAYNKLIELVPNIKLFASDGVQAILIDEDALLGSAWNGDAFKAHLENNHIDFVFPTDGYVIWTDCLAIPKNPPHINEAYAFINFILQPEISQKIALLEGHAITNKAGRDLLPDVIRNNPMVYPDEETLKRGHFQRDVGEETLALYNQYWQQLKLAF